MIEIDQETVDEAAEPEPYERARSASHRAAFERGSQIEGEEAASTDVQLEPALLGLLTRFENLGCDGQVIGSRIEGELLVQLETDDGASALEHSGRVILESGDAEPRLSLNAGVVAETEEQLDGLTLPPAPEGTTTARVWIDIEGDGGASERVVLHRELMEVDCSSCDVTWEVLGTFEQPAPTEFTGR